MSSITRKVGLKQRIKIAENKLKWVDKYLRHYKLDQHFQDFVKAVIEEKDLPEWKK